MLRLGFRAASTRVQNVSPRRVNSTAATDPVIDPILDRPKDWGSAKSFDDIPGPKPLPLIGNIWRFMPVIGDLHGVDFGQMHDVFVAKYGSIMRLGGIPGRPDMIMLYDPEDVEHVYRNEGTWPIRMGTDSFAYYRNKTRKDVFEGAGGVLVTQGEEWGKFRSKVNQPMMQPRVTKFYVTSVDQVARDFLKKIATLRGADGVLPADFINEFYKWALESIVMIALDTRLGCLEGQLEADSEGQQMIDHVQVILESMFQLDTQVPYWKLVSTPTWKRFVQSMDFVTAFSEKYIGQARERLASLPVDSDREKSVLERILERDPNPKTACTMALDMMTAGIDTTSHSVAFLLYYLAINPKVQAKLQQEIDAVLPRGSETPLTTDHLNDLKYLKACIKESMRISPIAPGNMRKTVKDMVVRGYQVPKGTDMVLCHMTMSVMEKHYPDAKEFVPERWLKDDASHSSAQKTHPFVFMPFGFGPRSCVGRRFADLEIETLAARIVQAYHIEWHQPPLESECKLLHTIKSPLKFTFVDRK